MDWYAAPALPLERKRDVIWQAVRRFGNAAGDSNATLEAIGLHHHQHEIVKDIHPALVGQLKQVRHLVEVSVVEE